MDADALLHMARIVREATEGKALVGTYYAYLTAPRDQPAGFGPSGGSPSVRFARHRLPHEPAQLLVSQAG